LLQAEAQYLLIMSLPFS